MSQATAMAEARELKTAMSDHGVKSSIELQIGRAFAGDDWYTQKFVRMHHHVVSRRSMGLTPFLALVKGGRSDLPGPLCNGYGGYDRVYRIICMGLANHPGLGGPITIDGVTIPKNSARVSTWGTEWEGGLEDWTDEMLEFMGRGDAALADWMGRPLTSQMEHSTWTPRKSDRRGFTRARGIDLTVKWSKKGGDDDMDLVDLQRDLESGGKSRKLVKGISLGATLDGLRVPKSGDNKAEVGVLRDPLGDVVDERVEAALRRLIKPEFLKEP